MFRPPYSILALEEDSENLILIVEDEKEEEKIEAEEMEKKVEEVEKQKEVEAEEKEEEDKEDLKKVEEQEEVEEVEEQEEVKEAEEQELEGEAEEQEEMEEVEEKQEEVEEVEEKQEVEGETEEQVEMEETEEQEKVEGVEEQEVEKEDEDEEVERVVEEEKLEGPAFSILHWSNNAQCNSMSCTLWSNIYGSNVPEDENPLIFPPPVESEDLAPEPFGDQVTELVHTLIFKHGVREPITKEEMVEVITKEYEELLPTILEKASTCLEVIFGIDVKEMDSNTYVLVNSLGLTFEDKLNDDQVMPRNGLLIMLLGVIFLEENCAPEEKVWAFLNMVGVYAGQEHFIYGEPKKFITIDLVQENYVEYRQVLYSDPPRFEFLWGPRALAETTKMKVLEFLAKVKGTDVISFSDWYEEALRDDSGSLDSDHADDNGLLFITEYFGSIDLDSYDEADLGFPQFDFEAGS